jgi:hypothetical protein
MNRLSLLTISAATALGLALLAGNAVAQQKSPKERLTGTWPPTLFQKHVGKKPVAHDRTVEPGHGAYAYHPGSRNEEYIRIQDQFLRESNGE